MGTFTNSEDPDEMPHNAAFHQGLHCLLKQIRFSEKIQYVLLNYNLTPPRYLQWTISSLLYQTRRKNSIVYKGLTYGLGGPL